VVGENIRQHTHCTNLLIDKPSERYCACRITSYRKNAVLPCFLRHDSLALRPGCKRFNDLHDNNYENCDSGDNNDHLAGFDRNKRRHDCLHGNLLGGRNAYTDCFHDEQATLCNRRFQRCNKSQAWEHLCSSRCRLICSDLGVAYVAALRLA